MVIGVVGLGMMVGGCGDLGSSSGGGGVIGFEL